MDAPDLWPWLNPYYAAFEELSSDRPVDTMSGSIGLIPWSAIDRYCQRNPDLGDGDFDLVLRYLRVLDFKYLALVREATPKEPKGGKPASHRAPPPAKRAARRGR